MHAGHLIAYELELRERLKDINRAKREFAGSHGRGIAREPAARRSFHFMSFIAEIMKIAGTRMVRIGLPLGR